MRFNTSPTRRAIDKWKERISTEVSKFYLSIGAILTSVFSVRTGARPLIALILVLSTMFNFALSELALLTLLGFLTAKLHCYRLLNSFLRLVPPVR